VDGSTRDRTVNPKLKTPGSTDLYLVVGVGGTPSADLRPVPGFSKGLGGDRIVEQVNVVLVGAGPGTEAVGSWV
jgi:hypothetical protein